MTFKGYTGSVGSFGLSLAGSANETAFTVVLPSQRRSGDNRDALALPDSGVRRGDDGDGAPYPSGLEAHGA